MFFPLTKFWAYSPHGYLAAVVWNCSEFFGVTHRKWSDPETAAQLAQETLGDKAFSRTLLSPAQMEKLGDEGKSFVAVASFKPEAGKRVVY